MEIICNFKKLILYDFKIHEITNYSLFELSLLIDDHWFNGEQFYNNFS